MKERVGEYEIIDQRPREGGGTIVRYKSAYGGGVATLRTLKESPEDIRRDIEKHEAFEYGCLNPSPESIRAWSSPGLLNKMN